MGCPSNAVVVSELPVCVKSEKSMYDSLIFFF